MALVTDTREQEPLLVLVDELVRTTQAPVLVPDLRAFVSYVLETPSARELFFSPTIIFHALRDMVADGLVVHTTHGYKLTPAGIQEVSTVRTRSPDIAERAAQAVREYAVQ
jgi:hypothetical protein